MFYPRVICPFTGSDALQWRVSKGMGTVYATTVVYPQTGEPYNVALIVLDPEATQDLDLDDAGTTALVQAAIDAANDQLSRVEQIKRFALIRDHLPADWGDGYPNVWLGVSAERDRTQCGQQLLGVVGDRQHAQRREQLGGEQHHHLAVLEHGGHA